jgi:hypothetical protein
MMAQERGIVSGMSRHFGRTGQKIEQTPDSARKSIFNKLRLKLTRRKVQRIVLMTLGKQQ